MQKQHHLHDTIHAIMKFLVKIKRLKLDFLLKQINESNSERIHDIILSDFNADNYKTSNVLYTSTHKFNCIFHTLRDYNKSLMRVTTLMKNNVVISADWCRYDYMKIPFDEFFTDEWYHLDKVKELKEYVRLVGIFKTEYNAIKTETLGTKGYNYRQMTRFNNHINDLTVQITRASYEISLPKPNRL